MFDPEARSLPAEEMSDSIKLLAKYSRYNASAKGKARRYRHNRTLKRLKAQRERNQVRRERTARKTILTLANGGRR